MPLDVLYLDNHLLVVNKPPGMLVQGDRTGDADLLSAGREYLKARFDKPGNVFLGLVHRLDRPVSGVVVFGRTSKGASRLSDQFRRRVPDKRYVAIVEGALQGTGILVDYLVREGERVRMVPADRDGAKRAELEYRVWATEGARTLVEVRLKTGRRHQIRAQLAQLGHPIVGDLRYGARTMHDGRNMALHCYHLGLEHPTLKAWRSWSAAPPQSWSSRFTDAIQRLIATESC